MTSSETKPDTLLTALLAVQAEAITIKKAGTNPHFSSKYVTLEALMEGVMPLLNANGLVWVTRPGHDNGTAVLDYELIHVKSDGRLIGTMPLMLDKQNSQGLGSALTYARRQSLMAVVGIVGEADDDGNRASEQPTQIANDRLLTDAEINAMNDAIKVKGADKNLLFSAAGIDPQEGVSIAQARKIREMLDAD